MSTETFARETRMSTDEARLFVDKFYQTFPTMKEYLDGVKQRLLDTGCVQSIHGRPLCFDLARMTSNEMTKARVNATEKASSLLTCLSSKMERQAINFIVQASTCDLMKMAMDRVTQALDRIFPFDFKSTDVCCFLGRRYHLSCCSFSARPTPVRPVYLILQVHDELIFEIESSGRMHETIHLIRQEMERHEHLHLSLPVKVQSGANWDCMMPII